MILEIHEIHMDEEDGKLIVSISGIMEQGGCQIRGNFTPTTDPKVFDAPATWRCGIGDEPDEDATVSVFGTHLVTSMWVAPWVMLDDNRGFHLVDTLDAVNITLVASTD